MLATSTTQWGCATRKLTVSIETVNIRKAVHLHSLWIMTFDSINRYKKKRFHRL